ncbi:efflux RND transporter permease subunit [Magnetospira sp. QH-2]|uniref:efflux RND transporter permease subunit n=1 Tax=Magnetospira sp. (strain QH-2) TaxID=1288970 RepID=UPI0003E81A33|nr:efflux RND transporter permease subunit [Magnetospira sp. QH-2]CCQ74150.1 Putative acriflavin resistance protein [Magnetospira sp. QH-2]
MDLIRTSIHRPIAVVAAVLMVVLFGMVALQTIPIQLIPDVNKPLITVDTRWPGAAPAEVEREIVNRQEEVLRGLEGLDEMTSRSRTGRATVRLEFAIATDMDKALLLVSNRLDRVNGYPEEVDEPTLDTAGSEDSPIAWFGLTRLPGNDKPIHTFGDYVENVIQDRIERVPGVSRVNVYGGSSGRMEVVIDPAAMARYGLTVPKVVTALRQANVSVSAGSVDEGKRRYVVRSEAEFTSLDHVRQVLLRTNSNATTGQVARVTVGDIAEVRFGHAERGATIRRMGQPAMGINAVRETGANVIETMAGIREAVTELNKGPLPRAGLHLRQIYDETFYIESAIDLVKQNIWIGGSLAAVILMLFLRSWAATLIITLAIPVSVIGSFVAMAAMGRSINVISLAGIAFAVGMVVDAAIVVLENIYRLRQEGKPRRVAAYQGAKQVWGAVLVSALTTVMVFIPLLTLDLEVGQLFRDIAVAISVAVMLSLVVAVSVIPALAKSLLRQPAKEMGNENRHIPLIDPAARMFSRFAINSTRTIVGNRGLSLLVVAAACGLGALATWAFLPKLEYLPDGNRNLIFGSILPPPGYNLETTTAVANDIESAVKHLWTNDPTEKAAEGEPPKMDNFFFVAARTFTFVGASSTEGSRVRELIPILRGPVFKEPGTLGFMRQPSIFGRTIGSGRTVDVQITGAKLEEVLDVARRAFGMINGILPRSEGHSVRPRPGLELGAPEVRIYPDPVRLADNGVTAREFGDTVDAFNDGLRVAEITVDGERIDLTLMGPENRITQTQGIEGLPIVTASGTILPLSSLADVTVTTGPIEIRHQERERVVILQVNPSRDIPLETAMQVIDEEVLSKLRQQGMPDGVRLRLAGTADKLVQTWDAMVWQLLIAIAIVYLVMAVLFESFVYPLIILFSVPLATAGGIGGLALLNTYVQQPLDMLTMLGFVILIGIVVNNAILLVHQTLHHLRDEGVGIHEAILEATRNRIRPIFMSTLTSVFGMLPLVLFPGAGSELYRGLGSVVLGGLALSAILTLLIIPPLLTLVVGTVEARRLARRRRRSARIAAKKAAESPMEST